MKLVSISILITLPIVLSAFLIDSSIELYYSDQMIQEGNPGIVRYQEYIYIAGAGGVNIYQIMGDSLAFSRSMEREDVPTQSSLLIMDDKLYIVYMHMNESNSRVSRYALANPEYPDFEESLSWIGCFVCFFDSGLFYVHEMVNSEFLLCHVLNPLDFTDELTCYTIPYEFSSLVYAGDSKCVVMEIDGNEYISHVFDISDPLNIHEAFSLPIGSLYVGRQYAFFNEGVDEYLLFSAYHEYVALYNITDHDEPVEVWRYNGESLSAEIDDNDIAHILCSYEMLGLDINDPSQPEVIYQTELSKVWDIECAEGSIITAGRFLTVHELIGGNLVEVAQAPLDGTLDYTGCNGDFLYLGTYYQSLVQLDIRNPVPPIPFQRIIPDPDGYSVCWISCTDRTIALKYYIQDPVGRYGYIYREDADGELSEIAFLGDQSQSLPHLRNDSELFYGQDGHLYRYTVSDDGIELVESIEIPECYIYSIGDYGDYLYISDDFNIFVVYAPEEGNMELVNTLSTAEAALPCFEFIDNFMIVGGIFYGEQSSIFDISDPADPVYLYGLNTFGPMGIDEENELLFIGYYECCVYDLSPLLESGNEPDSTTSFTTSDTFTGFYPLGDNKMVCVNRTGVEYIEYSHVGIEDDMPHATALSLSNYPNPFNPETTIRFDIPSHAQTTLSIYNIKGQLVRTLLEQPMDAGEHNAVWNGTDNLDKPVSSGVYLYRLESGDHVVTRRMLLIK